MVTNITNNVTVTPSSIRLLEASGLSCLSAETNLPLSMTGSVPPLSFVVNQMVFVPYALADKKVHSIAATRVVIQGNTSPSSKEAVLVASDSPVDLNMASNSSIYNGTRVAVHMDLIGQYMSSHIRQADVQPRIGSSTGTVLPLNESSRHLLMSNMTVSFTLDALRRELNG